ncbi:mechanosensitive ion channel family protein [Wenzhouxiangella sp. XN201]|uniref:mechanosensitive ion channel family protein n=1 Tax=Wenzhouxiangella sp. XN201 TaxID=2710755 RepID=UPI0013C92728|nr:mechanosensitive ion channel family protein [Wenzhouxiangella sp. XN201]NEZ02651.1 mechanosensitive ion channel family protein [Wenzhouxiangella sp. XN201]
MSDTLHSLITSETFLSIMRAVVMVGAGLLLASLGGRLTQRLLSKRLAPQTLQLTRRAVFYGVLALFIASAMRELGFSLAVIMGAAGILTVAIGFASQTTASNLISGLFLIGERSFEIGDFIQVGETTGEVLSIDALSVKLRTLNNVFIRIPNETLIKSEVITITRYPIRRYDLMLGVAYKEDLDHVREVLMDVAEHIPACLDEPEPIMYFLGFGESELQIQFSVWSRREDFLKFRSTVATAVKRALDDAGIEIPFPHRSLYAGEATRPFPVTVVDPAETQSSD